MSHALRSRYLTDAVTTASPSALLIQLCDRLEKDLADAQQALEHKDLGTAHATLVHAQQIVAELHNSLQPDDFSAGRQLADLYRYAERKLVEANVKKSVALVTQCRDLLGPLIDAWRQAARAAAAATGAGSTRNAS